MRERVRIGDLEIGTGCPPVVIAELSANHNRSLDRALAIVDAAAEAGVHGVKLQTYTPETMTLDLSTDGFVITDPSSPWYGRTLFDLYTEAHTPWEWHEALFQRCRQRGLLVFSTPFDASAVAFLEGLGAPCYKIASFENTDLGLIQTVAQRGKPVIISTGMATAAEIDEAINTARREGAQDVILLKCTSAYPAAPEESHLLTIPHMRSLFGCPVGLSDHTPGIGTAVAAVGLGAVLIEKHLTLRRADGGVDAAFSLEPNEMRMLVLEVERAWKALGAVHYGPTSSERPSLALRRSLYVVEDMQAGERLSPRTLRAIRPGYGLPPKFYDVLLGRRVAKAVRKGTPVTWDLIE